ncbi:MAG TPA: NAD(P)-dependent alcohol dehydrogenase [Candidatus Acidoferrum sp.]|jgi:NADPH:quinone reductase-like Zn-dependent oxidoreductase|nr:NAD(P)-dependent alcohol dehydrogenase [Candidatus Acidoferrum sp.]
MRAVVADNYGPPDVQHIVEVPQPIPKADEVLIRIHATTVTRTDIGIRSAQPALIRLFFGLRRPKQRILGTELAGEIEAIGSAVTKFAVGDHVFGSTSSFQSGAHAEYIAMKETAPIALAPAGMTFEQAAAVTDGAVLALMCLEAAHVQKGQKILIYGASGAIGTAGVQLAKYFETDVTAVCNTKNVDLVKSLGADTVIDYLQEDFTKNGETYDVIFDAVGKHSFKRSKGSLKPGGVYVATDGFRNLFLALWTSRIGDRKAIFPIPPRYTQKTVLFIKQVIEAGKFRAVIDRSYPLEDVVEATRYVETQQKTGNVVLTIERSTKR